MAKLQEDAQASGTIASQVDGQTAVNPSAQTATEKKLSPKNKLSRGVSADTKTTWVPFNQSEADNEMIRKAVAHRNSQLPEGQAPIKVAEFLATVLQTAFEHYRETFVADAAKYTGGGARPSTGKTKAKIENMTPEEAAAFVQTEEQKLAKKMEAANILIAQAKARAAAAKVAS